MSVGRDEYKRAVFDRQGPEAAHFLQTVSSLIIPIVSGAFAAELYVKAGLRERAETLYRSVQRLAQKTSSADVVASNRLVDLYLAWPGHETKGLRELRRLVDTYPETDVAERARAGLVNLKSQLGVTE